MSSTADEWHGAAGDGSDYLPGVQALSGSWASWLHRGNQDWRSVTGRTERGIKQQHRSKHGPVLLVSGRGLIV